jgi:hypothetical protein
MQPVPIGVSGELYIGGVGVARGYVGDEKNTQDKFVPNPFVPLLPLDSNQRAVYGTRIYKTGDIVRWLPNATLEYIGRTDFQVKLRGIRIELGEIETVITECEGVKQAVVMVHETKTLVAYITPEVDEAVVRAHVNRKLPLYMVPQVFVMMTEFPMNSSGKVDRKLLPAPQVNASARLEPSNDKERILLEVWSKVLNLQPRQIGVEDSFFSLGGDSIIAVTLAYHAKQQGLIISTQQVLTNQTIPSQAEVAELSDPNHFETQVPWGTAHLSPVQQWILTRPLHTTAQLKIHQHVVLQLHQPMEVSFVSRALGHLILAHPTLRTEFNNSNLTMTFKEPTSEETEKLTSGIQQDHSPLCEVHALQPGETLADDFGENGKCNSTLLRVNVYVESSFQTDQRLKNYFLSFTTCVLIRFHGEYS